MRHAVIYLYVVTHLPLAYLGNCASDTDFLRAEEWASTCFLQWCRFHAGRERNGVMWNLSCSY